MNGQLGRLERVELREIWATEAQDFTPWLALESNLTILAETLNLELELETQEKNVGPFRADILCKDTGDGSWVLIENQLERTDHTHLGQLMTYASGLQAVTIVWVAAKFTDEHRAALDWLNEITDESFRFFGLEIELWRIGTSQVAPKFNIICQPNDWTRSISRAAKQVSDEITSETKAQQLQFWLKFVDFLDARNGRVKPGRLPKPRHWYEVSIGRSGFNISATVNSNKNRLGVEIIIKGPNAKPFYYLLEEQREEIEAELGYPVEWQELPDGKWSRIIIYRENSDPTDESAWPGQQEWVASKMDDFDRVFRQRIRELDPDDWQEED